MHRLPEGLCRSDWQSFLARYNEHKHACRNNSHTSKFAQHLNEQAEKISGYWISLVSCVSK